ncbi:MAG: hypothetical protein JJE04_10765 [Acidobacteriia bacterium]|nr:hypothetical protein [Terriglobia bacterium]
MTDKRSPRPASPKKAAAARANGAKSKGPLTAAGKSRSSQNAVRHGCYSNALLLCNEKPADWEELLLDFISRFNPIGKVEIGLVEEMAAAHWRIRRYWFAESATIDMVMLEQQPALEKEFVNISEPGRLSCAVSHLLSPSEPQSLQFYHRLESRLRRHFSRALSDLLKIQQLRLNSQPAPLPQEPITKNDETNPPLTQPPPSQPLAASPSKPGPTSTHSQPHTIHLPTDVEALVSGHGSLYLAPNHQQASHHLSKL